MYDYDRLAPLSANTVPHTDRLECLAAVASVLPALAFVILLMPTMLAIPFSERLQHFILALVPMLATWTRRSPKLVARSAHSPARRRSPG